jgi:hypothetical protein
MGEIFTETIKYWGNHMGGDHLGDLALYRRRTLKLILREMWCEIYLCPDK